MSYISGKNSVLEAIRTGERIEKVYLRYGLDREIAGSVRRAAKEAGIAVTTIDRRRFSETERRAGIKSRSQGILARIDPINDVDPLDIVASAWEEGRTPMLAALDGVTDPHNVGAVIRSVSGAGIDGLVLPRRRSGGITDVVARSSAGAIHSVSIGRVDDLAATLARLSDAGLRLVGFDDGSSRLYTDVDFSEPTVLVFGSEGEGMSPAVEGLLDEVVSIPMMGAVGSLNVSVAAGVVMYEALRQRRRAAESRSGA